MIKNSFIFSLALIAILCTACGDDDGSETLNYDGSNLDAPVLEAGGHITCARFTSAEIASVDGFLMTSVEYYLANLPSSAEVVIFQGGSIAGPDSEIYSANVTLDNEIGWNEHAITSPIAIGNQELWICLDVQHPDQRSSVGCDAGPANENGDWIFSDVDPGWQSLRDRTNNGADINWNIRGNLEEN